MRKFEKCIFALHFLNMDISLNISCTYFKFEGGILCDVMEGNMSQIFDLGPNFCFR